MKLSFLKNNKKQTFSKISILLLAQLLWVTPSFAVTIKVGEDKITERQIRERANFNLIITNKPTNSANRAKIRKKTIEQLINETIQIAEAKKNGIKASDREINKRVGNIASSTRMTVSQLSQYLSSKGSSLNAMKGQHRAAMAWSGLIGRKFASLARVSDKEIDAKSKKLGSKYGKTTVYDLRHILLQMPTTANKAKRASRFSDAQKIRANFTKCSRIRSLTAGISRVKVSNKPDTSLSSLSSARRNLVKNAKVASITKARAIKGGVEMYAVCKKTKALSDKTRKKLQSIIVNEKMKGHASSYLKTLRKSYNVKYL